MRMHVVRSVLEWLRGAYPTSIPDKDHFALLAVLRRRLTEEEIDEVVALSIERAHESPDRHINHDRVRTLLARKVREEPSDEDMTRVSQCLEHGGWPSIDSIVASTDDDG
jgi:hypothetical protein